MTFRQLQKISSPHYYSLLIDKYFPKIFRNIFRKLMALGAIVSFVLSFDALPLYFGYADAVFFLFIIFYLLTSFLEFFYRSMTSVGVRTKISENLIDQSIKLDYALSSIIFVTDEIDATRAIFESKVGIEVLIRAGIREEVLHNFVFTNRSPIITSSLNFVGDEVDLVQYIGVIYDADQSFQHLLNRDNINKDDLVGAADWVMRMKDKKRREDRFWSRENLGAIPSIGKSWSYGVATDLGQYGVPLANLVHIALLDIENGYREREVSLLEGILEKKQEANAIIIDDDQDVARDIVGRLVKRIKLGISAPSIEHKDVIELDWNSLVASYKNKMDFEYEFLKILNQSINAGNVVLYIENLSGLVSELKNIGINLGSIIAPYLLSPNLQIIASATNTDFHFFIETNPTLIQRFERIIPDKVGVMASVPFLLEEVIGLESKYKLVFSYPAILHLANSAERFIAYGEMPGKALDLLVEIAPWANQQKISLVRKYDAVDFVVEKTGVPGGHIGAKESNFILHLEEALHRRVVGQDEAVNAVATAIRRVRSQVTNPKRPLSSFLFIGPTGVGKTEISKALAESFFGDETKMLRFDMSEYSGAEALAELIGDFTLNKSGFLANKVRDNPYSVLLLDELEKASRDVLDLFLQILDEGMFTDALGKQVNCRNLIIIGTSNAGSSLIREIIQTGKGLESEKEKVIDLIIKDKIFKPELINRFNGIILFHPLQTEELKSITKLELQKLVDRLKGQSIELVINETLVDFLVSKANGAEFGGRAINRVIQSTVEDFISKKIVSGEAKPGSKIEINEKDLVG